MRSRQSLAILQVQAVERESKWKVWREMSPAPALRQHHAANATIGEDYELLGCACVYSLLQSSITPLHASAVFVLQIYADEIDRLFISGDGN